MNDELSTCDARAEAISLLAAEALSTLEEQELRQHLAGCQRCRVRFEQASIVGEGLRSAKASQIEFDLSGIVARTMAQVADDPTPPRRGVKEHAVASQRSRRWQSVALAIAGCVVAIVVGRSLWVSTPSIEDIVVSPPVAPSPPLLIEEGSDTPTLIELQRAAAVSDEALDRLLTQSSSALTVEPFSSQSLWQESQQ